MEVLVLDNYDSFTYNLVQYIEEILDREIDVFRNDAIELDAVNQYDVIVLSPGPGVPQDAGIMPDLIRKYAPYKHLLGVCLGHQAIGEAFGAELLNLDRVYHGTATQMRQLGIDPALFKGLDAELTVGRYHSWVIRPGSLPPELLLTATDDRDQIMAIKHRDYEVRGVQFHPESILTETGYQMLVNYFQYVEAQLTAATRPQVSN